MNLISLPNIQIEQEYHTLEERNLFLKQEAERMRNNPTEGEKLFKQFCDKYNIKYEYQVPITLGYRGFILDFLITTTNNPKFKNTKKRKMVIEIDGEYHNTKEQKKKDAARTKTLKGAAYTVFRLTNEEVKDEKIIIQKLLQFLPTIKEKTLLEKITKLNDLILSKENSDNELYILKKKYEDLKDKFNKLKEWALQVQSISNKIYKSCPVGENIIDFWD